MDGYQNSVRAVMRAAGARRLRGVLGPVSTILKVEPGCEVAIETALGGALQNIVVENEAAAKAAIALLRNDHAGRATFFTAGYRAARRVPRTAVRHGTAGLCAGAG